MDFPTTFIAATTEYTTQKTGVPAPYLRRSFTIDKIPNKAEALVCGLGFYELFINGQRVTKGLFSPYISNPDHCLYYDSYDLTQYLQKGENVIGLWLGNGFQNNPGGQVWDFDKAGWRGAPCVAFSLDIDGYLIETNEDFLTAPSPIYYDDYRAGEYYDARNEIPHWAEPGFDACGWKPALRISPPRGEALLNDVDPICVKEEICAVNVKPLADGYLYDFGINASGFCRLCINAEEGQQITLNFGELILPDGTMGMRNIACRDEDAGYIQKSIYICKGSKPEIYTPTFVYNGFQYVWVRGITAEQAVPELLTYLVLHTDLHERGGFFCSDETVNTLQKFTRRSTLTNFHHFPTDCPHREKNGWTGDAALSAEHTLLNLTPERNYKQWLQNIRKAQRENGMFPGIIPTGGWGYHWGNGPAFDRVLVYLPYFTYIYRGDETIVRENATAILRYLEFLTTKIRPDGLLAFGLGDWCTPGRNWENITAPLEVTDTAIAIDLCEKAAFLFEKINLPLHKDFAQALHKKLLTAARARLLNLNTMTAFGDCQTSQAMAIAYNLFSDAEKSKAMEVLLKLIERDGGHMGTGVMGARVIFHVLAEFGYTDLALNMITQPSFPSYGWWITQGATSLWEDFQEGSDAALSSRNHHFWGDISHFFIRHLAGIYYNPNRTGGEVDICPKFASTLSFAEGFHIAPEGEIRVRWERNDTGILLCVTVPDGIEGFIKLPFGYLFDDGRSVKAVSSGKFELHNAL